MSTDRTVHGVTASGDEIVRYDRAGKWWIEAPSASHRPRVAVTLAEAVAAALLGTARLRLPGGGLFDAKVRKARGGVPT